MTMWVLFLGGPVVWLTHFMLVYVLVEAACDVDGGRFRLFGVSALSFLVVAATVVAAGATLLVAVRAYRSWRGQGAAAAAGNEMAFAGFLLAAMFFVAVLFVGLPAMWLKPC